MTNPSDPAYPMPALTKREHFACEAMKGFLCNPDTLSTAATASKCGGSTVDKEKTMLIISALAIGQADALIKHLNENDK